MEIRALWAYHYTLKKSLGMSYTQEEKESNIALRILSNSNSKIEQVADTSMGWTITSNGRAVKLKTRRYPSSDLGIMSQIFCKEEYAPAVKILKERKLAAPKILDAGANAGYSALYFKAAFPDCELTCLEIDPSNFQQLSLNLAPYAGVRLERNALWKRESFLTIGTDFRDQTECSYYALESPTPTDLKGYSLRHYMNAAGWDRIDLLKIDIEGSERYLFESPELAKDLLSVTDLLAIEIHDEFNIRPTIYSYMNQEGFTHFERGDVTIAHRPR